MQTTYIATLYGDRLEWENGRPELPETAVRVQIIVADGVAASSRGLAMAAALEALAAAGGPSQFADDPVTWQRELRKDRSSHCDNGIS